jgi:hypothetical protein
VRYSRGESEMKPTITNMFEAELPFGTVNYRCSADKRCDSFTVTNGRVRGLRFDRVDLIPAGSEHSAKIVVCLRVRLNAFHVSAAPACLQWPLRSWRRPHPALLNWNDRPQIPKVSETKETQCMRLNELRALPLRRVRRIALSDKEDPGPKRHRN